MTMTHDELVELDKLLSRMSKKARDWRFTRWIILAMALLSLGITAYAFSQIWFLLHGAMPKDPTEPVDAFALFGAQIWMLAVSVLSWTALLFSVNGGLLAGESLGRWRKGQHDALLIKMARSWLEAQKSAPPSGR